MVDENTRQASVHTRTRSIVNSYCPVANCSMNLIRRTCRWEREKRRGGGRRDGDKSYASSPARRIRQENPFRRASPLIASRLKGREAEMDYPREGEKSAFAPPSRAKREIFRDVFRKLSIYLSPCSPKCAPCLARTTAG